MTNYRFFEPLPARMLSKQETAEILGISISSLDRLMKSHEINFIRVGLRRIGFRASDIEAYSEQNSALPERNQTRENVNLLDG